MYAGKRTTYYRVLDKLKNKDSVSIINGIDGIQWPDNLERLDRISKQKYSFEYCVNSLCTREPFYARIGMMLFIPSIFICLFLMVFCLSTIKTIWHRRKNLTS